MAISIHDRLKATRLNPGDVCRIELFVSELKLFGYFPYWNGTEKLNVITVLSVKALPEPTLYVEILTAELSSVLFPKLGKVQVISKVVKSIRV